MGSVDILRAVFFGIGTTPYKPTVKKNRVEVTLPIKTNGEIPAKPLKSPFLKLGLATVLLNPACKIAPSNLDFIDVASVTKGKKVLSLDDDDEVMDLIPDTFLNALETINREIETATGVNADETRQLTELFAPSEQITEQDLRGLGLNVENLARQGLTIEVINSRGLKLEQLKEIAFGS